MTNRKEVPVKAYFFKGGLTDIPEELVEVYTRSETYPNVFLAELFESLLVYPTRDRKLLPNTWVVSSPLDNNMWEFVDNKDFKKFYKPVSGRTNNIDYLWKSIEVKAYQNKGGITDIPEDLVKYLEKNRDGLFVASLISDKLHYVGAANVAHIGAWVVIGLDAKCTIYTDEDFHRIHK